MPSLRKIRLTTGLVLYVYVTLHFANHALGNVSIGAMESGLAIQKLIWQSLLGAAILYASLLTHMGLGFWALYERRRFRWTRTRSDPTRPWPFHSIPADQSRDRDACGAEPVWTREGLCAGTREFLGRLTLARRAASSSVADRLDSRLPRRPFLAAASAVLPAREGYAAFDCGAPAGLGAARLLPGRRADLGCGARSCLAGAHSVPRARRLPRSERGSSGRAHGDARFPSVDAGRHTFRPGLPTMERAPGRLDPADLSRSHHSRTPRLQRPGREPR